MSRFAHCQTQFRAPRLAERCYGRGRCYQVVRRSKSASTSAASSMRSSSVLARIGVACYRLLLNPVKNIYNRAYIRMMMPGKRMLTWQKEPWDLPRGRLADLDEFRHGKGNLVSTRKLLLICGYQLCRNVYVEVWFFKRPGW
jgi:hypothetical protein